MWIMRSDADWLLNHIWNSLCGDFKRGKPCISVYLWSNQHYFVFLWLHYATVAMLTSKHTFTSLLTTAVPPGSFSWRLLVQTGMQSHAFLRSCRPTYDAAARLSEAEWPTTQRLTWCACWYRLLFSFRVEYVLLPAKYGELDMRQSASVILILKIKVV